MSFLLPNWLASVCLAAIFQFKGETPWVTGIKGPHLTGQQADVYGVVLGQGSNQHQDRPWQRGSAPVSTSADWLECCKNTSREKKELSCWATTAQEANLIQDFILEEDGLHLFLI